MDHAILTCVKRGVNRKACRLWYKLNENTKIRVKTGAGLTSQMAETVAEREGKTRWACLETRRGRPRW